MDLEARHLRIIAAVAREGSVSGAARALHLSQPAISAQLGRIEKSLDLVLFDRSREGVRATRVGAVAADHAQRILRHFDLLDSLPTSSARVGVPLRVGGNVPSSLPWFVGDLITQLPDRQVMARPETSVPVLDRMLQGAQLDLALLMVAPGLDATPPRGVRQRVLVTSDPLLISVAGDGPLAALPDIGFEDLAKTPWLLPAGAGGGMYDAWLQRFADAGYSPRTPVDPIHPMQVSPYVARGLGVTLSPSTLDVAAGVTNLPIRGRPLVGQRVVRWRPDSVSPQEARLSLRLAAQGFAERVTSVAMRQSWWTTHPAHRPEMAAEFDSLLAEAVPHGR